MKIKFGSKNYPVKTNARVKIFLANAIVETASKLN